MKTGTLYYGGPILTMEDHLPAPEALLVEDGCIADLGSLDSLKKQCSPLHTEYRDLKGKTLMPAFIDPHSHFSQYAHALLQIPLEDAKSLSQIQERIRSFLDLRRPSPGEWLIARGYDHNLLKERRHPSRFELDAAAPDFPLVLQHRSGHMGVFNTCALQRLGVTADTPSPSGGAIGKENGELTGYMEENAFLEYLKRVPSPDFQSLSSAFRTAQERYASYGITTIQDGMIVDEMIPLYKMLLEGDLLKLDLIGYPGAEKGRRFLEEFSSCTSGWGRFKIGGLKIFLDGSPQGRTAWMRGPYLPDGFSSPRYCEYRTMTDEEVLSAVRLALDKKLQLLAHCNGDAAAQQYIRAFETAFAASGAASAREFTAPIRPVIIHAQLIGKDQLVQAEKLGMIPSFFAAHIYYWGDIHIQNFGMERASCISPAATAGKLGIPYTFHQDSPVLEPDMLKTVWCAVNRLTKNGVLLGPEERVSALDALKAVTINAAYQYFEESQKGSLRPGKRADLVILGANPLTEPEEDICRIPVAETIKDGESIYRNPACS